MPALRRPFLLAGSVFLLLLSGMADADTYRGAATVVAREGGTTVFDNGVVTCSPDLGQLLLGESLGIGGVCLRFDGTDTVHVEDPLQSDPGEIAYQVCVDHNQDNLCSLPETESWDPLCPDWIRFSHKGPPAQWANPMGGIPTELSTSPGCPGPQPMAWNGPIVFVCSGVHDTHEHKTASGTVVQGVPGGTAGFDAFTEADVYCGPPPGVPAVKAYAVVG